jgi:hypothetical protein
MENKNKLPFTPFQTFEQKRQSPFTLFLENDWRLIDWNIVYRICFFTNGTLIRLENILGFVEHSNVSKFTDLEIMNMIF